jgi:hypothetical protein
VPLDPCGNPLPAPPAAAPRPTAAAAPVLSASEATAAKTFSSDKPADQPKPPEGWGGSALRHVDPDKAGGYRVEKPATDVAPELRKIESIPTPAAKEPAAAAAPAQEPTVAPTGPSVFPPPPATDGRDVPAAETSGRPWIGRAAAGHST